MRIIAGTHRRMTLLGPQGDRVTRPITDRVKQSLFDRLWSEGALDCQAVLDLFAGTGSLGIEALSRGVKHCTFVERDRSARQLLEKNLSDLGLTDRATVLGVDAMWGGWFGLLAYKPVGLLFCDPPYKMTDDAVSMTRVAGLIGDMGALVALDGVLVLRTDSHAQPEAVDGWDGPASYPYGSMAVHFYERDKTVRNG